jgi:hypothetical protein
VIVVLRDACVLVVITCVSRAYVCRRCVACTALVGSAHAGPRAARASGQHRAVRQHLRHARCGTDEREERCECGSDRGDTSDTTRACVREVALPRAIAVGMTADRRLLRCLLSAQWLDERRAALVTLECVRIGAWHTSCDRMHAQRLPVRERERSKRDHSHDESQRAVERHRR